MAYGHTWWYFVWCFSLSHSSFSLTNELCSDFFSTLGRWSYILRFSIESNLPWSGISMQMKCDHFCYWSSAGIVFRYFLESFRCLEFLNSRLTLNWLQCTAFPALFHCLGSMSSLRRTAARQELLHQCTRSAPAQADTTAVLWCLVLRCFARYRNSSHKRNLLIGVQSSRPVGPLHSFEMSWLCSVVSSRRDLQIIMTMA